MESGPESAMKVHEVSWQLQMDFFQANSPHQVACHVTPSKKSDISIYTPPGVTPAGSRNQPTPARSGATARWGGGVEVGNLNRKKHVEIIYNSTNSHCFMLVIVSFQGCVFWQNIKHQFLVTLNVCCSLFLCTIIYY